MAIRLKNKEWNKYLTILAQYRDGNKCSKNFYDTSKEFRYELLTFIKDQGGNSER